jgi:hypothetical protein
VGKRDYGIGTWRIGDVSSCQIKKYSVRSLEAPEQPDEAIGG